MSRRWPSEQYVRTLLRHLRTDPPKPGTVTHVEVRHDDDCAHWKGRSCDCDPAVASGPGVDRRYRREREGP